MIITVACPEAIIWDANHLAMVLAYGAPEALIGLTQVGAQV